MPIQVLCNFKIASSRGPRPCDKVYPIIPHSSLNGYECYGAMAFSIETLQLYSDVGESLGHGPALSECLAQVSRSSPSMAHCQKQCQIPGRGVSGQKRVSSSTIFQGKRGQLFRPSPDQFRPHDHIFQGQGQAEQYRQPVICFLPRRTLITFIQQNLPMLHLSRATKPFV